MPTSIYDGKKNPSLHPVGGVIMLAIGIYLSVPFVREIVQTIREDLQFFPAAFRESPVITMIGLAFKAVGYPLYVFVCGLFIYMPFRDFIFPRVVSGRFESVAASENAKGKWFLAIRLDGRKLMVRQQERLEKAISENADVGEELRFTVGAFQRVMKVEKL